MRVIDNFVAGRIKNRINEKAKYHEVDIRDLESITPIINGAKYVFHLAAFPRVEYSFNKHPQESDSVNVGGTVNVSDAAQKGGVERLVYSASSSAYGDQEAIPLVETMPTDPNHRGRQSNKRFYSCKGRC